jgi:hypothetical protein
MNDRLDRQWTVAERPATDFAMRQFRYRETAIPAPGPGEDPTW